MEPKKDKGNNEKKLIRMLSEGIAEKIIEELIIRTNDT